MGGRIVLLEGADGSGKSTLARDLKDRYGARVMHGRVWRRMARWHAGMMRRAVRLAQAGELVVLDRHWLSEYVYGPVFRGRVAYGDDVAETYDWTVRNNGAVVLCVPGDVSRHIREFDRLTATRPEMFATMDSVIRRYWMIAEGYMLVPDGLMGTDYLTRYVRHGDFLIQRNAFRYDRFEGAHVGRLVPRHAPGNAMKFNDELMRSIGWRRKP